jgi:hypothetical protein
MLLIYERMEVARDVNVVIAGMTVGTMACGGCGDGRGETIGPIVGTGGSIGTVVMGITVAGKDYSLDCVGMMYR